MTLLGYPEISPVTEVNLELKHPLHFEMNGVERKTHADIAMINRLAAMLCLYIENEGTSKTCEAAELLYAKVMAQALGAYNANRNGGCTMAKKEARLSGNNIIYNVLKNGHFDMVIPAFTLVGSLPCFYIIPITAAFASAVARGVYPPHTTSIFYCVAPFDHPFDHPLVGMAEKNQLHIILKMFEAFKRFIPTSFAELCRFEPQFGNIIPKPFDSTFTTNVWDSVRESLLESEQCGEERVDKSDDVSPNNYFVGSSVSVADFSSPQPHIPLAGYPSTLTS